MYKIVHIESGNVQECPQKPVWVNGIWECGEFRIADEAQKEFEVIEPDPIPPVVDKRITRLAFRKRFTQAENIDIEMAAIDNPGATIDERKRAAALRVDLRDTDSATHIDLARQDTREGVIALELFGLIGQGRAFEILDADINPAERPQ